MATRGPAGTGTGTGTEADAGLPAWNPAIRRFGVIPHGLLAALVRRRGAAEPDGISPLALWPEGTTVESYGPRAALAAAGILQPEEGRATLTPEFARAADVLRAPRTHVTLRTWSDEGWLASNVLWPGGPAAGQGVVLTPAGDEASALAAFAAADDVWRVVAGAFLDLLPDRPALDFAAHLDAPTAAALFAVADLARRDRVERLAWSATDGPEGFTREQVLAYLDASWGASSLAQLLTAAVAAGGWAAAPAPERTGAALEELAGAGLLERTPGGYRCGATLPLAETMLITERGLQWQRVSRTEPPGIELVHRVVLAAGGAQLLSFERSVDGHLLVRGITRDELSEFLLEELALDR